MSCRCDLCGMDFPNANALDHHYRTDHPASLDYFTEDENVD